MILGSRPGAHTSERMPQGTRCAKFTVLFDPPLELSQKRTFVTDYAWQAQLTCCSCNGRPDIERSTWRRDTTSVTIARRSYTFNASSRRALHQRDYGVPMRSTLQLCHAVVMVMDTISAVAMQSHDARCASPILPAMFRSNDIQQPPGSVVVVDVHSI